MLKPLHDNVIVEPIEDTNRSKKGFILSASQEENSNSTKGVVVAIGDGKDYKNNVNCTYDIKVGDVVFFKEYSGTTVIDDEKTYKVLSYEDIIAVSQ